MISDRIVRLAWHGVAATIYLFLFLPMLIIVIASFNPDGISFPPTGFTLEWYGIVAGDSQLLQAGLISVVVALGAAAITLPLVVLMGLALRDRNLPGSLVVENLFLAPLSVPQVVIGLALLIYLRAFGITGTVPALIFGHLVITIPYTLRTILAALKGFDQSLEDAARNLGASWFQVVWYVTLPLIRPALIAGAGFAFIMSFTNFTISVFLIGPRTVTLPVQIFQYITFNINPAVSAIATTLIALSLLVVIIIERSFGIQEMSGI